jgi:hypothetical protein
MTGQIPQKEIENLSAYLDRQLDERHRARLEARLLKEPELQAILRDLGQARLALKSLPRERAPRNFTLTPEMAGVRSAPRRTYPALGWASALASILLVLVLVGDFLSFSSLTSGGMIREQDAPVVAMQQPGEVIITQEVSLKEAAPEGALESAVTSPTEAAAEADGNASMAGPSPEPTLELLIMATPYLTEELALGYLEGAYPPPSEITSISGTSLITPTQPMDATQGREGSGATATATPEPLPTEMPLAIQPPPTDTPLPTNTSLPTDTPEPTKTPSPDEEVVSSEMPALPATDGVVEQGPTTVLQNIPTPETERQEPVLPFRILEMILGLIAITTGLAALLLSRRAGK